MPVLGNPTVFFGRDKPDPSDNAHSPIPSIEDDDGSMVQVVSDIGDGNGNGEDADADSGTEVESVARANSGNFAEPEKHGQDLDKKLEPSLKGKGKRKRSARGPTATVRRSSRISSVIPPKKAELLAAKAPPAKRGRGRPAATKTKARKTAESGGGEEWEVQKVVGSQIDAYTSEHFYLVKWKGYPAEENTWEPKKNLGNCRNLIRDFEKTMSK